MAKVYVTKYALSAGIKEAECDIHSNPRYPERKYILYKGFISFYMGKDAFLTKEEAIKKAEDMRKKKISSLKKQIDKLEKLKFEL